MHHVEDVGRIILEVQQELAGIRDSLGGEDNALSEQMQEMINRAQADLRAKAEVVLNGLVNQKKAAISITKETSSTQRSGRSRARGEPVSRVREKVENARRLEQAAANSRDEQVSDWMASLPRSNQSADTQLEGQLLGAAPKGTRARGKLNGNKGILPRENRIDPQAAVPAISESDAMGGVMNLIERGLIPNGVDLAPAFADSGATPLMSQTRARIHDFKVSRDQPATATGFSTAAVKMAPKPSRDMSYDSQMQQMQQQQMQMEQAAKLQLTRQDIEFAGESGHGKMSAAARDKADMRAREKAERAELRDSVDQIRGYNELLDTYSLHQFLVRHGKTLDSTPEFLSFRRKNIDIWGAVTTVVRALEALLTKYCVPMAYIDGQAVVRLAQDELEEPTTTQLLECFANFDQVSKLIKMPGQRFKGEKGQHVAAATCIQTNYRMAARTGIFKKAQVQARSALRIESAFRGHAERVRCAAKLLSRRKGDERRWKEMVNGFRSGWDRLKERRRVAVHIPSLSYEEHQRARCTHYSVRQNLQLAARLCSLADPLVDVIYVVPFELSDDVKGYYQKLLKVGGVDDPTARFKLVFPENTDRFPSHFSLTTKLLYSPLALRKIKRFTQGKDSYLVPGVVGPEDRSLSLLLDIPMMGPSPQDLALCMSKSGAKRVFCAADVNIPVGAHDVYDREELVTALVKLVATNLDVERWLVRVDDDVDGSLVAFLDVASLRCADELRRERLRLTGDDGEYWMRPEVQEVARAKIEAEFQPNARGRGGLPSKLTLPNLAQGGWTHFEEAFLRCGAVIEAAPGEVQGYPQVHLFIEPSSYVHVMSTHEKLCSRPHHAVGSVFPQRIVPHAAIAGAATAVGHVLYGKGVHGYVTVDFVAFWDSFHGAQRLWAQDLQVRPHSRLHSFLFSTPAPKSLLSLTLLASSLLSPPHPTPHHPTTPMQIGLSNAATSFVLYNFIMGGQLDSDTGEYMVSAPGGAEPASPTQSLSSSSSLATQGQASRSYVVNEYIYHPNLQTLQYSAFFNLCRLHGVAFDLQERLGTAFMLVDSLVGGVLGMMSVGSSHADALATAHHSLEFIQEQVGTTSVRKEFDDEDGNFMEVVEHMKSAMKTYGAAADERKAAQGGGTLKKS
jgi:hypothetical protein